MIKKKMIIVIGILFLTWLLWVGTVFFTKIDLQGSSRIYLDQGQEYVEEGVEAYFFNRRLSVQTTTTKSTKDHDYEIYYAARNPFGIVKKKTRKIIVNDNQIPEIKLNGSYMIVIKQGQKFCDPKYKAYDNKDGDITSKVKVTGKVDSNKIGNYKIQYSVSDQNKNEAKVIRKVKVVPKILEYKTAYNNIDNQVRGWGHGNKKNHIRSKADVEQEELAKYDAFYMGPNTKKIYLTFDEGSNDTYLKEIFEVLRNKKIKATFFLCRQYMISNQDLIKEMVEDEQLIGNHTWHHKSMPTLATENNYKQYLEELTKTEETYQKITGQKMPKIYREPAGEWSYRSLKLVQDMGYRTYFWSAAYMDYGENVSKGEALQQMMKMHHNGVIYLLHPKNKGNYLALSDFIDNMIKLGYEFATVDEIV